MARDNPRLRLVDFQNLLAAASTIEGPKARALELAILTLRPVHQIVGIDLSRIDWSAGVAMVGARMSRVRAGPDRSGVPVYLGNAALAAILKIAGSAVGKGQAVTAGRGRPLTHRDVRLDRLQRDVAAAWTDGAPPEWTFHALRTSAADLLSVDGVNRECIYAALGVNFDRHGNRWFFTAPTTKALGALARWEQMLFRRRG